VLQYDDLAGVAISVEFGPVSDPDPTAIGGESDLGLIRPLRSGPRWRAHRTTIRRRC